MIDGIFSDMRYCVDLTSKVIGEVDGLDKIFKCARSSFDLYGAVSTVSEGTIALGTALKACCEIMAPFQFVKVANEWFEVGARDKEGKLVKNWAATASLTCGTALSILGVAKFLEKMKLYNHSAFIAQFGTIPVLGLIVQTTVCSVILGTLGIAASAFNICDQTIKINEKVNPEYVRSRAHLNKWIAKEKALEILTQQAEKREASSKSELEACRNQYELSVRRIWDAQAALKKPRVGDFEKFVQAKWQKHLEFINKALLNKNNPSEASSLLHNDITAYVLQQKNRWTVVSENASIAKTKAAMSIVCDVLRIGLSIIMMVGSLFAVAALSATSLTILGSGLLVTTVVLGKKFYDTRNKEPKKLPVEDFHLKIFKRIDLIPNMQISA